MSSPSVLKELSDGFARLSTEEEKAAFCKTFLGRITRSSATRLPAADGKQGHSPYTVPGLSSGDAAGLLSLLSEHGFIDGMLGDRSPTTSFALEQLPCAFINPVKRVECDKAGTKWCSQCKLVAYCSTECQKKHWSIHKRDCNGWVRSKEWQPTWVVERRTPIFVTGTPREDPLSLGMHLWGNVPAMDILRLDKNENATSSDFQIAFIASGDLRNAIATVNALPDEYTGELTIVLNDLNPYIALRNLLILQLLGSDLEPQRAADISLHVWYSAFLPVEYRAETLPFTMKIVQSEGPVRVPLRSQSTLTAVCDTDTRDLCSLLIMSSQRNNTDDATEELTRIRFDPSREDLHQRLYCQLEPSHRLAFLEFRRFSLTLPFSAHNAHFNVPNPFLFSPQGDWLQSDHADPLKGWDIEEVIASGRAHGASREDIYGCLYFHVSDVLRKFVDRLSSHRIRFKVFRCDAADLGKRVKRNELASLDVPASIRFDRVETSNVMDAAYQLGIPGIANVWSGLLKPTPYAKIIGLFMNWTSRESIGKLGERESCRIFEELRSLGRVPQLDVSRPILDRDLHGTISTMLASFNGCVETRIDTSTAFDRYLSRHGLAESLHDSRLTRLSRHTVVPQRFGVAIGAPATALPDFPTDESWYLRVNVGDVTWTERYIELGIM